MAAAWVKSLQCKSNAVDDVYDPKASLLKKPPLLSCSSSSLRDIVLLFPRHPPPSSSSSSRRRHPPPTPPPPPPPKHKPRHPPAKPKSPPPTLRPPAAPPNAFPTLAELPAGHSSRRVVEIIFSSSWSLRSAAAFPGEIEILFRVHNPPRTAARFEEYRAAVRARAGGGDARCAADGNEMMRFHCGSSTSPAGAAIYDAGVACCAVAEAPDGKAVRTFAGSRAAHEAAGGGSGRRAMLVCRVIAGRVRTGFGPDLQGESVSVGPGELLVFDQRAVLPCFLIIYKV